MPTEDQIRLRAYYLSLDREREELPGSPEDDWLLAEAELADQTERAESDTRALNPPAMPPTSLRTSRSAASN